LGRGAGSVIYAVREPATGRDYALKHVVREGDKELRWVEQMETELHISRDFRQENLRRSFELHLVRSWTFRTREAFLLMELVQGESIEDRPLDDMLDIIDTFTAAARGLEAMHHLGFVHCDFKPNNVLRDEGLGNRPGGPASVKIIDFGQSCRTGTVKHRIQGTADYMAPEQLKRQAVTPQTDVYCFGAAMYWALTRRHVPTLYTVSRHAGNSFLLTDAIDPPEKLNPGTPAGLSHLVMECVQTNPAKRPASMHDVIGRLEIARHVVTKQREVARHAIINSDLDAALGGAPLPSAPHVPWIPNPLPPAPPAYMT
ncbi:MAG: serine/threonine protein kinase, partial [Tepidisphaeraceae bacterium]